MELFKNPAVIWFILGFVLFLLEFALPGLILFFFAVGAWITAILLLFFDLSLNFQIAIFLVASVLSIIVLRKELKKMMWARKISNEIEDELIGKSGIAETFIGPGQHGTVEFKGTIWQARSEDIIQKGERVTIIGNDSILLIVKSSKTLS